MMCINIYGEKVIHISVENSFKPLKQRDYLWKKMSKIEKIMNFPFFFHKLIFFPQF